MTRSHSTLAFLAVGFAAGALRVCAAAPARAQAQRQDEAAPLVDQAAKPALEQQRDQTPPLVDQFAQEHPTAAELRTVASVLLHNFRFEEYQFRSAAEAMPAEKYGYRPAQGDYGGVYPVTVRKSCARLASK
jgi:hypothetical protein